MELKSYKKYRIKVNEVDDGYVFAILFGNDVVYQDSRSYLKQQEARDRGIRTLQFKLDVGELNEIYIPQTY